MCTIDAQIDQMITQNKSCGLFLFFIGVYKIVFKVIGMI